MKLRSLLLIAAVLCSTQVMAANSQQEKMKTCNADAKTKNLSGDARKSFMSSCLKADSGVASAPATQQDKMKVCNQNASAQALKGDARKTFMSDCLKKKPA
ncbi:PsiF family protein [Amantichitinum ursilacus]|uniref:Phosphate starvation-inducible protein PsiF n=1 Tax=Amantichitinum ursilacus TaxID=857265 RepID=A0A0N0GNK1_9NEIS|nr:PsiF family protein [Amantichitinum ursilacus]KPC52934.1 Phosphate starvation-inducible protein PsiF precursor [Amantichitinum ursilacus]